MGIPTNRVIGKHGTLRCRNCYKKHPRNRKNQIFCTWKCRSDWHHNGGTPTVNVLARVKQFCKSEAFAKIVRNQVKRELAGIRQDLRIVQQLLNALPPQGIANLIRVLNLSPSPAPVLPPVDAPIPDRSSETLPKTADT